MDAEKMLGGLIGSFFGSAASSKAKGKRMRTGGKSVMDQISRGMKSPQGILAAVGLAFGAYEAYKNTQGGDAQASAAAPPPVPGAPPPPSTGATPPPVPGAPPAPSAAPPPIPGAPPLPTAGSEAASNTAIKLIQAMIAAAYADGELDEQEREQIITRMKKSEIGEEEEKFLATEIENPKTIAEITAGLTDPVTKRMMFGLSVAAIVEDTEAETKYLQDLAAALELKDDEVTALKQRFERKETA